MRLDLSNPQIERFIAEQLKSGKFTTPEAVVEDALARMMEEDTLDDAQLDALDAAEDEADRGEVREWRDVAAELRHYGLIDPSSRSSM
jgi:Arc/MetJ-type ribon-helix-helix transcriptional regulator